MNEKSQMVCFVSSNRMETGGSNGPSEISGPVEFCIRGLSDPKYEDRQHEDTFVRVNVTCPFQPHQSSWSVGNEKAKEVLLQRLHDLIKTVEELP